MAPLGISLAHWYGCKNAQWQSTLGDPLESNRFLKLDRRSGGALVMMVDPEQYCFSSKGSVPLKLIYPLITL